MLSPHNPSVEPLWPHNPSVKPLWTHKPLCGTLVTSQTPLWNPCELTNPSVEPLKPHKPLCGTLVTSQPLCGTLVTSQPLCGTHQKNKYILRELDLFYIPRTLKLWMFYKMSKFFVVKINYTCINKTIPKIVKTEAYFQT